MRQVVSAMAAGLGLGLAAVAGAAPALAPGLQSALESAVERRDVRAAVVGLYQDGSSQVFGFGRIGPGNGPGDERTPGADTVFEIGSVTKVFTALLAEAQVQAGRLDWDAPIAKYLEGVEFASDEVAAITPRELASHTSGLPRLPDNIERDDPFDPYAAYGRDELFAWLAGHAPGTLRKEYAYSNLGAGLLGIIAADAAGLGYGAALERDVLDPLGLSATGVGAAAVLDGRLAPGFSDGADMPNWTFQAMAGAGAVLSTAGDLLRLIELNLADDVPPLLAAVREEQVPGRIALGWHIEAVEGEDRIYWHNGGTGGYASFLAFRPATRTGVVILTASTEYQRVTELGLAEIKGEVAAATADLSAYPGTYRLSEAMHLRIFVEDGRLFGQATGQGPFPLEPAGVHSFAFAPADVRITFAVEGDGPAQQLTFVQAGNTLQAPRVADDLGPRQYREIEVDADVLGQYVGRYELQPGAVITIEARGGQLYAQLTGQPAFPVFPYAKDRFFFRVVDAQLEFKRDDSGTVTGLVLHQAGPKPAPRIE
jgi:CubicO group peptidase (beta-lactamase class C family)